MKPKIHSNFSPKHLRGQTRLSIQTTVSSFATICLLGLAAPYATAATVYTVVAAGSPFDWNTDVNWTPTTAAQYPGTAVGDTALVTGDFGGLAKIVDLSATPATANALIAMTLGDTNATPGATTVRTSNASSLPLTGATITSAGTLGAVNTISAPITLVGGLTIGASTNDLTISGKITPSAAAARTISNASAKTVSFGDIDLSIGATTSAVIIQNQNNSAANRINLGGVIANGSSAAATLTLDGRVNNTTIEIGSGTTQNTYSGATILQSNGGGGRITFFRLNATDPFGTGASGTLTIGQPSGTVCTFDAITSARTISNPTVTLNRGTTFQGSNSISFSGTVTTGSSHALINNITGSSQLIFNGRYNLDNSANASVTTTAGTSDSRIRTFAGTGITVMNGVVADHANPTADMLGGVSVIGTGTVLIVGTSTFQGDGRITGSGTLQLGNGGITGVISPAFPNLSHEDYSIVSGVATTNDPLLFPAFVKKSVVTGGTTGTGSLVVKHSDDIELSSTINGGIGLKQTGSGILTVSTPQFNTGANQVGDGITPSKLVVTAAAVAETTQPGDFDPPKVHAATYNTYYQTVTNLTDTSLLKIGQPAYINTASGAIYIHSIDSPTQVTLFGTGIVGPSGSPSSVSGLLPSLSSAAFPVVAQAIKFGAGSSLGTSAATTTVKALSTLAGTGTISGAVTVEGILAPGSSVGTLATGPLKFNSGSTLAVEIDTTALTSDKVVVTGNVVAGASPILTLTDVGGNVALPNGTKFVLVDYSGTYSTTSVVTYLGNPVPNGSSITLGANTFYVNYTDAAVDGTALTLTSGPAPSSTAYETWINAYYSQLPTFSDGGPTLDPDNDGRDNLLEFALNGNPGSGSNNGKMVVSSEDSGDVGTNRDLTVTLAVRSGAGTAVAGPGGSLTLTVDGIVYTIQGSQALQTWDSPVDEVTPASTLTPAPDAGWETRTFRVTDSDGLPDKRFIRVGVQ